MLQYNIYQNRQIYKQMQKWQLFIETLGIKIE